jgi:hypothetical protein
MSDDTGKRCTRCGERKPLTEFSLQDGRRRNICKACLNEYNRLYYRRYRAVDPERYRNPERSREYSRRYRAAHPEYAERQREQQSKRRSRQREAVFDHYGRVCACCGTAENLTIDHPDGDGADHRIELWGSQRGGGTAMYLWLAAQGFPDGYQVLCMRCNQSKGRAAACRLRH